MLGRIFRQIGAESHDLADLAPFEALLRAKALLRTTCSLAIPHDLVIVRQLPDDEGSLSRHEYDGLLERRPSAST